jgi:hypothetical protein
MSGPRLCLGIVVVLCLGIPSVVRAQSSGAGTDSIAFGCTPGTPSFAPILRQDFSDISLFKCPSSQDLLNAVGSRVTATFDEIAHTTSVTVDGLAAGVFRVYSPANSDLIGVAFGPYVQGSEGYKFETPNSASMTMDTITAGGFAEFAFKSPLALYGRDYFRIHGGEEFGNSGITSTTITGEWLPVYGPGIGTQYHFPRVGQTIVDFQLSPELMVQYDQLQTGPNKYFLFAENNEALRVGPEFVLKLWLDSATVPVSLRTFADQSTVSITYHAAVDAYSGRDYSWVQAVFTYNLNQDGNVALSASYGYGNSEMTGNITNQIKLGLAGKL